MLWFFLQGILSDVLKCLGDNKKHMRESTLTTLDAWLAAVHLDKMVSGISLFWLSLISIFTNHDNAVFSRFLMLQQL